MRILICDDDSSITQSLSQIIKVYFKKKEVNVLDIVTFNDGDSLLSDKSPKDIVFLDVEMSGFDGIYVGNELKKQNESAIIFIVTSHLEYLDAAMRFHVFRYLSKPIDKQRLFQNLDDALELYYSINQKIAVETKSGVTSVLTCDIVYVEAKGRKVIVTSHLEYLDAAMRFHVFRYLSKPIDKQRLFQNLDDALELYYSINQKIAVETKSGVTSVLTCDIVYVEAKGRKVIVHTATADLDSTQTLQFWIDHLPQATFFQSHRSYIVNMAMVTSFDHELIYLCDGQFTAYLTRRKFTEFKKAYLMFMESKR